MNAHMLIAEEEKVEAPTTTPKPLVLLPLKTPVPVNLFSDCLLDSTGPQRRLRGGSLLFSAAMQCLVVGILILIPLVYTDVLPAGQLVSYLMTAPPPPPPPPPAPAVVKPANITSNIVNGQLLAPTAIPTKIQMIREDEAPPPVNLGGVIGGVVGGVPGGQLGGVVGGIIGGIVGSNRPPVVQAPALAKRVRISSGISEGMLLSKIKPEYPHVAQLSRIEGTVILEAIISREGLIENLHVVSGNPILVGPAMDAVRQWRYRPYLLSGMPVEVETKITVNFGFTGQ